MNLLKNLLIIAVLAAVGYGVYVSLARNNVDPGQPPGVAEGWPAVPKVEMPSGKPSPPPGGPLALGGNAVRPAGAPGGLRQNCAAVCASADRTISCEIRWPAPPPADARDSVSFLGSFRSCSRCSDADVRVAAADPVPRRTWGRPTRAAAAQTPAEMVHNLTPPPEAITPSDAVPPAAAAADSLLQSKFAAFMDAVQKKSRRGQAGRSPSRRQHHVRQPRPAPRAGQADHRSAGPTCRHGDLLAKTPLGAGLRDAAGRHARTGGAERQRPLATARADQRSDAARAPNGDAHEGPAASGRAWS